MSIKVKATDKKCPVCLNPLLETSIKNPFLDDFMTECGDFDCPKYVDTVSLLNGSSAAIARQESRRDNAEKEARDHEEFYADRDWKE